MTSMRRQVRGTCAAQGQRKQRSKSEIGSPYKSKCDLDKMQRLENVRFEIPALSSCPGSENKNVTCFCSGACVCLLRLRQKCAGSCGGGVVLPGGCALVCWRCVAGLLCRCCGLAAVWRPGAVQRCVGAKWCCNGAVLWRLWCAKVVWDFGGLLLWLCAGVVVLQCCVGAWGGRCLCWGALGVGVWVCM